MGADVHVAGSTMRSVSSGHGAETCNFRPLTRDMLEKRPSARWWPRAYLFGNCTSAILHQRPNWSGISPTVRRSAASDMALGNIAAAFTSSVAGGSMSLAGRWMGRVRCGSCAARAARDQDPNQIVPPNSPDHRLESRTVDPEEKREPASDSVLLPVRMRNSSLPECSSVA
jgi:hypothetical protein